MLGAMGGGECWVLWEAEAGNLIWPRGQTYFPAEVWELIK
jgi:hypothetical protein